MLNLQILIMFVIARHYAQTNLLDDLRHMCPYNDLCTVGQLLTFNHSRDYISCCVKCFCDDDCKKFHDCCPDVEGGVVMSPGIRCTTTTVYNPAIKNLPDGVAERSFISLRMTSSCPKHFNGSSTTVRMCAENFENYPSFEDMVIVSNRYHHDDIYKNRHCASCNGVQETIRWHFFVASCPNVWNGSAKFSELKELIWSSCLLYSSPPEHLQLSRPLFDCGLALQSTCTDTNSTYRDSCEMGPYIPFYATSYQGKYVYRNPFCFLCRKDIIQFSDTCRTSNFNVRKGTLKHGISMLIRADAYTLPTKRYSSRNKICNERQIFDWTEDRCRTLSCPWNSVVFYGRCLKLSGAVSNVLVPVTLLFRPAKPNKSLGELVRYTGDDEAKLASSLQERFGFKDCSFQQLSVVFYMEKANDKNFFLLVTITARVSQECSFDFIVNNTRKLASQSHTMFVSTKDSAIPMTGQMYFAETLDMFDITLYDGVTILFKTYGTIAPISIKELYICPYLKLKFSGYNSLMTKLGQNSATLAFIDATSLVYDGFYVLSDDVIAVCVDTYFDLHEKKSINEVNDAPFLYLYNYSILTDALFICHSIFVKQIVQVLS